MEHLEAETRSILGKKVKSLRREGRLPAVLYGAGAESVALILKSKEFNQTYRKAGESALVSLEIDGAHKNSVLIGGVQIDPVTDEILHVDLRRVKMDEKITAAVSIEITGESPIVKSGEGLLLTIIDEVEVSCFPADLPAKIEIDISELENLNEGISIAKLPVDHSKVEISGHEREELVVKIAAAEMEEEPVEAKAETATGEEGEIQEEEEEGGEQSTKESESDSINAEL